MWTSIVSELHLNFKSNLTYLLNDAIIDSLRVIFDSKRDDGLEADYHKGNT